jgi:hypothetical protein
MARPEDKGSRPLESSRGSVTVARRPEGFRGHWSTLESEGAPRRSSWRGGTLRQLESEGLRGTLKEMERRGVWKTLEDTGSRRCQKESRRVRDRVITSPTTYSDSIGVRYKDR